jgi:phage terminase Nu1 subunit (DNA packaging protein)
MAKITESPPLPFELRSGSQTARIIGMHEGTLRRWVREGCPVHNLGPGLVRYDLQEVLAWRANRLSKGKGERATRFGVEEQSKPASS